MSGRQNPRHILGRGRQWDGIPLTAEIRALFRSDRDEMGVDGPRVERFFDLWYDDGSRDFYVVTDQGRWHVVSEQGAERIIEWLRAKGFKPKSLERIRQSQRRPWHYAKPKRDASGDRDEHGNPVRPEIQKLTSVGREKQLKRRVDGEGRRRARSRRHETRHKAENRKDDLPEWDCSPMR
ncbi:hypothetical protein CO174_02845 [Candidatus Uhrbacteria bacterium CG_4_9_14_3_um_filter_50_9]|uniref:Uncharacterized protein n=1 Tax=Candidatus Uhrbacteria bacterium CG_4_9_14_3_um_filter_50_9 TaxID=1975035 RepID=A0A2M7XCA4_9BACT|nr:MAG: hypothetical protein CO174_02845 [Candidatus Uhrbacteria bacterium CG_4_9_14_3_um_filter_50_9]